MRRKASGHSWESGRLSGAGSSELHARTRRHPENPRQQAVYQRLRDLLDARQAIAFAGAGVSAPLYPLWPGLLKSLAQAPVDKGLASDSRRGILAPDRRQAPPPGRLADPPEAHRRPLLPLPLRDLQGPPAVLHPGPRRSGPLQFQSLDHHKLRPGTRRSPPRPPPGDPRNQFRHLEPARGNRTVAERGSLRPGLRPHSLRARPLRRRPQHRPGPRKLPPRLRDSRLPPLL